MVRDLKISVPVTEKEKKLIKSNAILNMYGSVAAFMRDKALETDISNRATLAILLTYISSKLGVLTTDRSLDWTRKKTHFKKRMTAELAGFDKTKRKAYLNKLDKTLENALKVKKELDSILGKYYVEE